MSNPQVGRWSAFLAASLGLLAAAGLALVPWPVQAGAGGSDTFSGVCELEAQARSSPAETLEENNLRLIGDGTCDGSLNGESVQDVPVRARAHGRGFGVELGEDAIPVQYSGEGSVTFLGQGATIGFTFQSVGPVAAVLQGNDSGAAAALFSLSEEQPDRERTVNLDVRAIAVNMTG